MATSDFNFRAITIPGVGELTAHSLGAQSVFNANTPATFYQDALTRLGIFYQQPTGRGQVTNPGNEGSWRPGMPIPPGYRVTVIRGRQVLIPTTEGQATPTSPPFNPNAQSSVPSLEDLYRQAEREKGAPLSPEERQSIESLRAGREVYDLTKKGDIRGLERIRPCASYDLACQLGKIIPEDFGTRGVLTLIGIVLLGVGLVALTR